MNAFLRLSRSSLGAKYFMAITGLFLIGFILAHMAGNLLIFVGRDALNSYANALKSKPGLLWTARAALFVIFVVHIWLGLRLTRQNMDARPVGYAHEDTVKASWASRHMLLTGLLLLAFTVYHLAHFTFGLVATAQVPDLVALAKMQSSTIVPDADEPMTAKSYLELAEIRSTGSHEFRQSEVDFSMLPHSDDVRHDVYRMVIAGFRVPLISLSYLVAMAFLALHLWHGGSSWFQSLGLNHPAYTWLTHGFGPFIALVVFVGNCSIPLAVLLRIIE